MGETKEKMRIVQIGGTFIGAQQGIETSIHNYLGNHGDDSYILYAIGNSEDAGVIKYEHKIQNIIRRTLTKVSDNNPHSSILSTNRIIALLKRINPDIVHLHILHHGYVDYITLLKYLRKKNIPVVYTMHDMWAFTGGCYYYSSIGCEKFKTDCSSCTMVRSKLDCSRKHTHHYLKLKKNLFADIDNLAFVSVSEWVNKEFNQSLLSCYFNTLIWNGIDINSIPKVRSKQPIKNSEKFRIIAVAISWGERKGILRFIELAKKLDDRFEIVLVGEVAQQYRQIANKNVIFFGPIDNKDELYELYYNADINMSLSSEETFGMTFLEAAMVGTKSIGLNNTAVPQILNILDGFVVNEMTDTIELLNRLVLNKSVCKLDDEKIRIIRHDFSSELMAQKYYELYKRMISQSIGEEPNALDHIN